MMLFILMILFVAIATGGILTYSTVTPEVKAIAEAIAKAEGFGPVQNLPTRTNNPGDLELGDVGHGTDAGKTIFPDLESGWRALYHQVQLMLDGKSKNYSPSDSWQRIANVWTGNDNPTSWARIVTGQLGVNPMDAIEDFKV